MKKCLNSTDIISFLTTLCMLLVLPAATNAASPPESFAPLVEKLSPAVVNISTTQKVKMGGAGANPFMFQLPDDPQLDPFRDFFDQFNRQQFGDGAPSQEREVFSLGSGFIIDASGYVVTNNHVIAEAEEVSVNLQDNTKLEATIVGRDPKTDLALLKVKHDKPLPFVRFGESDDVRVGDWIVAIGNPFGLGGSVTAGIISARSRSINAGPFDDFLQTDAAINRGNSGGPMFNLDGEVIGINTAIFSPSGGNVGIGFAVPSALAKPVLMQLKEYGRTYRGWLGVKIQHVNDEIAESVGLDDTKGALVLSVTEDSPAAKSGIQAGDIILSFDGKDVKEMRKLPRIVAETKVGREVELQLWRDGDTTTAKVTLGELEEGEAEQANSEKIEDETTPEGLKTTSLMGMKLVSINANIRKRFSIKNTDNGVLVLAVETGSIAAKQNIRQGDILLRVNGYELSSPSDLQKALEEAADDGRNHALVRLSRKDADIFVTLPTTE